MKKRRVALAVLVVAAVVLAKNTPSLGPSPLVVRDGNWLLFLPYVRGGAGTFGLVNLSFEDGYHDGIQLYWIGREEEPGLPPEGPYLGHFQEIRAPSGWNVAWIEGAGCEQTPAYRSGRPEVNVITGAIDPVRVFDGDGAAKAFTYWRCHRLALFQRVVFAAGEYRFSAMAHSWFSSCGDPYLPWPAVPGEGGRCMRAPFVASDVLQVCVDSTGGIDPWSDDVICGAGVEQYGRYGQRVYSPWVELSRPATVFLRAVSDFPFEHGDFYADSVRVEVR